MGREVERDALWDALRDEAPRCVVLAGPAGIGKTRLLTWLCHRALELGVADVVQLDCHAGLSLPDVRQRLSGRVRPVVVTLDEAGHSPDALGVARTLLRDPPDVPLLVLVALRPSEVVAPDQLSALLAGHAEMLELQPLDALAQAALVEDLLGLERGVAAQVAARAGGNPQFAVELVGDLIQRKVLVPGPSGFHLATGASLAVPDGLHQVWTARIEGIGLSEAALQVLELAAVLGREGRHQELVRAWPGELPQGLGERLEAVGLARVTPTGWTFSQSMLRQSLLRRAQDANRLAGWHAACADAVESGRRRARHLVGAGELQAALPLLLDAARDPGSPNAVQISWSLEDALDRLGVPPTDPRRAHMLRYRAEALLERSRYREVERTVEHALAHEAAPGWQVHAAKALACRGRARRALGAYDQAGQDLSQVIERFRALGDPASAAVSLHGLALVDRIQGRTELAGERIQEALRLLQAHNGSPHDIASAWISYGNTRIAAGEMPQARDAMGQALAIAEELSNDLMRATVLSSLAELDRLEGNLDRALERYTLAVDILRSKGLGRAHVIRINLGILSGVRGDWRSARHTLLDVQRIVARQGRKGLVGVCAGLVLPACAALGHTQELHEQLATAKRILDGLGVAEPDVAQALEQAAEWVEPPLRRELLEMACRQWERAGRSQELTRVRARLHST